VVRRDSSAIRQESLPYGCSRDRSEQRACAPIPGSPDPSPLVGRADDDSSTSDVLSTQLTGKITWDDFSVFSFGIVALGVVTTVEPKELPGGSKRDSVKGMRVEIVGLSAGERPTMSVNTARENFANVSRSRGSDMKNHRTKLARPFGHSKPAAF
jgi:hypothetical protein